MTDETFSIPRPHLAIRVGVTGKRKLPPAEMERLRREIRDVLTVVQGEAAILSQREEAKRIYAPPPPGAALLRLVSPLAEGADRRVAEEALALNFSLYAPLPFAQSVYEQDFPETVDHFRELLAKGEKFELDGAGGGFANESYREVGRYVVRNCDLLIAIWDGERETGPGGVAEIVRYALNARVPVWRIDPQGSAPAFIDGPRNLPQGVTDDKAVKELRSYLERTILPPPGRPREHGVFATLARLGGPAFSAPHQSPLDAFLAEKAPDPSIFASAYGFLKRWIMPPASRTVPQLRESGSAVEQWWDERYEASNRVAIGQSERYRSSYVWIALCASIALISAAISCVLPHAAEHFVPETVTEAVLTGLELSALSAIIIVVVAGHARRWHENLIAYRLLAELFRKQRVLASIGRGLPTSEALRASEASEAPHEAWVAWWFAAAQRAAPVPTVALSTKMKIDALAVGKSLIDQQDAYHENSATQYKAAALNLELLGQRLFFIAFGLTLVKAGAIAHESAAFASWSGAFAICVSAASAFFVAVRAYSEFALLASQSAHMRNALAAAGEDIGAINKPETPLASVEIGRALYSLTLTMLQDVGGWARLFRMKPLEAA